MADYHAWLDLLGKTVILAPLVLFAVLGLPTLLGRRLKEPVVGYVVQIAMVVGLCSACAVLALMLATGSRHVPIDFGNWVELGSPAASDAGHDAVAHTHFRFAFKFVFDRLSVPFAILTFLLCGVISAFANQYLHREAGFNRFFVFFALFTLGMILTTLAGTIETLFTGWELVGISSALLVAFFHERAAPVRNGLRVWNVYRISDAALLLAAIVLHHLRGAGDFGALMGAGPWPEGQAALSHGEALLVGSLLLVAAAGKSALIPFSGWLPRAMEGPTPSSAIFYGALSVHLGAFLLLRVSPILELSLGLSAAVVFLGLATAVFAALTSRVQADIKSALSFAALTQVGLIVAEIGLGLRYLALIHILGHACVRTLQFLRAPTLLHDYHTLENAIGTHLPGASDSGLRWLPQSTRSVLYRTAIQRGYLDTFLAEYVARPFLSLCRTCDAWERRWTDFLSGDHSRESDELMPSSGSLEELR